MSKKGFTVIELIISMAILSIIMVAVTAIFTVSLRVYQVESQRGFFQKELNFVSDAMTRDIKQSKLIQNYNPFILSGTTLILSLPSIDNNGNFLYSGTTLKTDTVIYYRSGTTFYKVMFANPASKRAQGAFFGITWKMIEKDVANVNFTYSPNINAARSVTFTITLTRVVGKKTVTLTATDTANLRNK